MGENNDNTSGSDISGGDIAHLSAVQLRDAIRASDLSAREVAEHFLDRIATENPGLGAFVSVTADSALAEADAADARTRSTPGGERDTLPLLHGLPIAHKDVVDVVGAVTTHGTHALSHLTAMVDSPIAAQLRGAGAISLGKTQVPEFALSSYSENAIAPAARNPLDPTRTPGGSSGGAAAAVAAGMLPLSPGSDGGGSVRIPALACGLIGLKPGLGAVPADLAAGTLDTFGAPRLVTSGPLAHTAADAALLFDAMTGNTNTLAAVTAAVAQITDTRDAGLRPLRIAVSTASPFEGAYDVTLSAEAIAALEAGIAALIAAGHRVETAQFHYDSRYTDVFTTVWTSSLALLELDAGAEARLGSLAGAFRARSLARDTEKIRAAGRALHEFADDARTQWGRFDAVLTPGLAFLPPRIGANLALDADEDYRQQCLFTPFTSMVNVTGLPAIAVPTYKVPSDKVLSDAAPGVSAPTSLSMGIQLIGPSGSEARLLQLAAQVAHHLD